MIQSLSLSLNPIWWPFFHQVTIMILVDLASNKQVFCHILFLSQFLPSSNQFSTNLSDHYDTWVLKVTNKSFAKLAFLSHLLPSSNQSGAYNK